MMLLHQIGINKHMCDTPVSMALSTSRELYVGCQESECIFHINRDGRETCLRDRSFYHYNAHLQDIDITNNIMVSCQNSMNDYAGTKSPNLFMGLTLYDLSLNYIRTDGSTFDDTNEEHVPFLVHVDMLHEAPNCTGVISINKPFENQLYTNRYMHIDNFNSQIVITDFKDPHGPGSMDHSSARVERIYGVPLSDKVGGVTADASREAGYVADTGNNRVIEVFYSSGVLEQSARFDYPIFSSIDSSFIYSIREKVVWNNIAHVMNPIDVALHGNYLYVLNSTGYVTQLDLMYYSVNHVWENPHIHDATSIKIYDNIIYITHDQTISMFLLQQQSEDCVNCHKQITIGQYCNRNKDCLSLNCTLSVCKPFEHAQYNSTNKLSSYLGSETYNRSFVAQHILTGGFGSYANYLNIYPIMEPNFCEQVGNATGTPDCDLIDFDSLLLGNCWGHPCLPNHLHCLNHGTLRKQNASGYICECEYGYTGDICHIQNKCRTVFDGKYVRKIYKEAGCCEKNQCQVTIQ